MVFLRTLGDFRIPAVVERRRKELLSKLEEIQGDTRREKPPKFEDSPEKDTQTPPVVKRTKDSDTVKTSESSNTSTVTSPTKRDSKVVNSLVSGFETLHATAKKEEEEQTPKKWQVDLRKTKKPADFTGDEKAPEQEQDEVDDDNDKAEKEAKESLQDSNELKPEPAAHHGSTVSLDSTGSAEPTDTTPKNKKKNKLQVMGGLFKKKRGRDKSPAPVQKETPAAEPEAEPAVTENGKEEVVEGAEGEAEPEELEEGVKVCGKLEHKVKTRLQTKYVLKDVKLKETTLYIGDKESVNMLGCTVQTTDSGLELFSHSTQKAYIFRVTEGGAEMKEKWTTAIREAIDEVTPKEEGKCQSMVLFREH